MRVFYKGDTMSTKNTCPVTSGWCWKNPLQVVLFLAVLPYAVKSAMWLWNAVTAAVACVTK